MYDIETTENTPPKPAILAPCSLLDHDLKKSSIRTKTKNKIPKIRTRTGCFTCRKRKKKCDEKGPVCSGCSRNFLSCVWPDHPIQNLPKDFEISSATIETGSGNNDMEMLETITPFKSLQVQNEDVGLVTFSFKKDEITSSIKVDSSKILDASITSVPSNLCTIFEIQAYKHKNPFPESVVIPDSIDIVLGSVSARSTVSPPSVSGASSYISPLDESILNNPQSISQMFDSLYADPAHSSEDLDAFYNDLLNYDSKVPVPSVSIRNPLLASFREIFYASGCRYLATNNNMNISSVDVAKKYAEAATRHYGNAISIIENNIVLSEMKLQSTNDHWSVVAINAICAVDKALGLSSENCILNSIATIFNMTTEDASITLNGVNNNTSLNFEKVLMSQLIFTYPFLIYFSTDADFSELRPPNKFYQTYNNDISQVLFSGENQTEYWLDNILYTAVINIYQNLTRLFWLLRQKNKLASADFEQHMKQMKAEMAVLWTTIQTAEIQSVSEANLLVDFAKFSHMSLEIMFLLLNDSTSVNSSTPIVGFYIDQFINNYESYLQNSKNPSNQRTFKIQDSFMLLPLFIVACSAQTLYHKEFISKELYILGRTLGIDFVESLANKIEDIWCIEQNSGVNPFSHLLSRDSFLGLVNRCPNY